MNVLQLFPEYERELVAIANKRQQKNLESYEKVQGLIKISKNSIFWSLKRSKNLYEIVKLRKDPSEFYFLNPNSLFHQGDLKKKKMLLPSHLFMNLMMRYSAKRKKQKEISLLTSSKQNEFEIITSLYVKVIDNTYDLQQLNDVRKSKKTETILMKKFLRQESKKFLSPKKTPRHNQVMSFDSGKLRNLSDNDRVFNREISSFSEANAKEENIMKKKSIFGGLKKNQVLSYNNTDEIKSESKAENNSVKELIDNMEHNETNPILNEFKTKNIKKK